MKNQKIIIAGGTGFIGQHLLKYFGRHRNRVITKSLGCGKQSGG